MEWISTAVVSLILIVIAALIIRQLIKDKKNGKHSCGGNCGCCPMSGSCHQNNQR